MNERIRELAEQAGFFPELNWNHTGWHAAGHNDIFEKLAELIVRECLKTCTDVENEALQNNEYKAGSVATLIKVLIKEHFGVEE